jgi:hypothetical protein
MDKIKLISSEIEERWHKKMPEFFYWVVVITINNIMNITII